MPSFSDSMAFVGPQGSCPLFEVWGRPQVKLMHLTSAPPWCQEYKHALAAHRMFVKDALSNEGVYCVAADSLNSSSTGLLFGMQHTPKSMTAARMLELQKGGLRVMALAYDGPTEYGCGFASAKDTGLTDRGCLIIEWMARCGVLLDLAHAGRRTARDALEFINREGMHTIPMASHIGCDAVFSHPRNFPDDLLRRITDMGGYVGMYAITFYTGNKGGDYIAAISKHIAHAVHVCGSDSVGIGSDCPHIKMTAKEAEKNYNKMVRALKTGGRFGEYFPDRPPEFIVGGETLLSTMAAEISKHLFPFVMERVAEKRVFGVSFKNYLRRALPQGN